MKTYKETCVMFEQVEISEQIYEGGTPSKKRTRADANHDGHVRKCKRGEATSPTNPDKGRAGKIKAKNAGHPSDVKTGAKKTCMLHGPGDSSK